MGKHAPWWDESRRGRVLGYGLRSGWMRTHITEIQETGPAAVTVRALCGGIQSIVQIDSGLDLKDQAACEEFQRRLIRDKVEERADCPRCLDRLLARGERCGCDQGKCCTTHQRHATPHIGCVLR